MKRTKRTICYGWVFLGLGIGLLGLASRSGAQWTEKAPMPAPRSYFSTSVVDGIIYAIGGGGQGALSTVEAYDPATDTWTERAPMPAPKLFLSTSVVDGIIYAMGGIEELVEKPEMVDALISSTPVSTVFAYDPATDTWTEKAPMGTARDCFSSSAVAGQIHAIGGWVRPGATGMATMEAYDPATDTWTEKTPMPAGKLFFSTSVVDGKIYAIGGGPRESTVFAYDPGTDRWAEKPPMPTARKALCTSVVNGVIYALGGIGGTTLSTVEAYDLSLDVDTSIERLSWGVIKKLMR